MPDFTASKFPLGLVVVATEAYDALDAADIKQSLFWHSQGFWGEVCDEDKQANDRAVADGDRILSAYLTENGVRFWVITEADRSATTVLLPQEY